MGISLPAKSENIAELDQVVLLPANVGTFVRIHQNKSAVFWGCSVLKEAKSKYNVLQDSTVPLRLVKCPAQMARFVLLGLNFR